MKPGKTRFEVFFYVTEINRIAERITSAKLGTMSIHSKKFVIDNDELVSDAIENYLCRNPKYRGCHWVTKF